jgi:hypothetical protein
MSDDPVADEITALRAQIEPLEERIRELRKRQEYPHVIPVQVFFRYHSERREDYDWSDAWNLLEAAYKGLEYMADDGQCSPVGVEVGGFLYKQNDLRERFGDIY